MGTNRSHEADVNLLMGLLRAGCVCDTGGIPDHSGKVLPVLCAQL